MERHTLNIQLREKAGSRDSRRVRSEGRIPGVLYGRGSEPIAITVDVRELRKALAGKSGHNTLLELGGSDKVKGKLALVRAIQRDPVKDVPTHADFQELKLDQKVHVEVPLHFEGKAKGVADGGILSPLLREIHIEALPNDIPNYVAVDITGLGVGESIHVSELKLPQGVRALGDQGVAVVTVVAPREDKAAEAAATPAEPTVLTAKAPAEGAAAAAPAKK